MKPLKCKTSEATNQSNISLGRNSPVGSHVKRLPGGHGEMPGKLIISVTCGGSEERFLLIHEGFPRVIDWRREILVPSFCDGRNWMSSCCRSPFPTTFSQAELCFSKDIQVSVYKGVSELVRPPALCSDTALLALTAH